MAGSGSTLKWKAVSGSELRWGDQENRYFYPRKNWSIWVAEDPDPDPVLDACGSKNNKNGEFWSVVLATCSPLPLSHWTVRSGSGRGMSSSWSLTLTFTFLAVVGAARKGSAAGRARGGGGCATTCKCHIVCCSVSDPGSIRSVDPYPDSESGSWSRKAKITHESREKFRNFMFWSPGYSLLRAVSRWRLLL